MFTPAESGLHQFRCTDKDDRATIWLDLDQDGLFELSGAQGTEKMGGNNNFTSDPFTWTPINLTKWPLPMANGVAVHGCSLVFDPSYDWRVIDPSDPGQSGFFKVPFGPEISSRLSPFILYQHGANEKAFVGEPSSGYALLDWAVRNGELRQGLPYSQWKHLFVNADHQNGSVQVFLDGNLSATQSFAPGSKSPPIPGQDWFLGQGTIPSSWTKSAWPTNPVRRIGFWPPTRIKSPSLFSHPLPP